MPRIARVVSPGTPHHVVQRGTRCMQTFFCDEDYLFYLDALSASCQRCGTQVWAYCLMPNHVHLILNPSREDGLRAATAEVHRRYTRRINLRRKWQGHLWQERFHSFPMDENHLLAAVQYVELNPVRAGLVTAPTDWRWSSAGPRIRGSDSSILTLSPLREMIPDWRAFLSQDRDCCEAETFRRHGRSGRPLGDDRFRDRIARSTGRTLVPARRGPLPGDRATHVSDEARRAEAGTRANDGVS